MLRVSYVWNMHSNDMQAIRLPQDTKFSIQCSGLTSDLENIEERRRHIDSDQN